jgi:hypothetical protein
MHPTTKEKYFFPLQDPVQMTSTSTVAAYITVTTAATKIIPRIPQTIILTTAITTTMAVTAVEVIPVTMTMTITAKKATITQPQTAAMSQSQPTAHGLMVTSLYGCLLTSKIPMEHPIKDGLGFRTQQRPLRNPKRLSGVIFGAVEYSVVNTATLLHDHQFQRTTKWEVPHPLPRILVQHTTVFHWSGTLALDITVTHANSLWKSIALTGANQLLQHTKATMTTPHHLCTSLLLYH